MNGLIANNFLIEDIENSDSFNQSMQAVMPRLGVAQNNNFRPFQYLGL